LFYVLQTILGDCTGKVGLPLESWGFGTSRLPTNQVAPRNTAYDSTAYAAGKKRFMRDYCEVVMSLERRIILGTPFPGSCIRKPVAYGIAKCPGSKNNSQEILVRNESLCKVQKKNQLKTQNMRNLDSETIVNLTGLRKEKALWLF
jgi:hypothetical protein